MKHTMRILTLLMLAVVVGTGQTWADALPDLGHIVFDGSEVTDKGEVAFYRDAECENVIAVGSNLTSEALTAVMDGEDIIGYTVYIKAVPNYDYTLGAADNNGVVDFITAEKTTNVIQAPRHSSPDPSIPRPNAIEVKATGERFVYSFTMPANGANATIHVNFPQRTVQQVEYIDVDGVLKDSPDAYVIDGSETGLGVTGEETWYVVPVGSVSYTSSLPCTGNVNLILADGATMAIGTADSPISGDGLYNNGGSISIYGQSEKTGKLTVYAEDGGIYVSSSTLTISSCEVEATATGEDGYGLYADNGLTINGGTVEATGTGSSAAIYASSGDIDLTSATVTAVAENAYAIKAANGKLTIEGGEVNAIANTDNTTGSGLYADGAVDISGATTVTALGNQYGINSGTSITISGGDVAATGTANQGIYTTGNINIVKSDEAESLTVTATGGYGIYSDGGSVTIEGGKVTATATNDNGYGMYADSNINISWTDKDNDFIDASSYNGTIVVADGQHFRAVSGENTMAFISGTLDKNDADDLDLINSLASTTLVPFETTGYVVTTVDADLTAGDEPNFTNGDTKFYVYEKDATVTVDYTGEGIVQVTGMDADKFSDAHTFAMPEEDVMLTYKGEVLVDNNFTLANSSVDYNAEPQAPGIKYDNADFGEDYYTLEYKKDDQNTPTSEVQNPGNYVVTLTGKGAYIGEVDINEVFVIMPSSAYATTLFAAGSTNQWMTWCGTEELVTPENVEVYTISGIDNSSVALEGITGSATFGNQEMNVIPAYTPVLIYRAEGNGALVGMFNAEGEGTPGIQTAEGTGCTFYGTTTVLSTIPDDNYIDGQSYVLRSGNFVLIDENNGIPANKCWLTLNDTSAPLLGINTNGGTTSLSEELRVKSEEFLSGESVARNATAEGWYSLDGRKFDGKPTKKGLYIYNGKKYVIK